MPVQSTRNPGEGVQTIPGNASFLEPRDDRLGGAHPFRELSPAEPRLGAQVVDELAEREVVLDLSRVSVVGAGRGEIGRSRVVRCFVGSGRW